MRSLRLARRFGVVRCDVHNVYLSSLRVYQAMSILRDAIAIGGVGLVVFGSWLLSEPVAFIVAGVSLLAGGCYWSRISTNDRDS